MITELRISQQAIEKLLKITEGVLGANGLKLIIDRVNHNGESKGNEVVFNIAIQVQNIFGQNGGRAIFRQIGRELAKELMESNSKENWMSLFQESLRVMGFAEGINKFDNKACICNCVFYPEFLEPQGIKPIEHTVCWGGLGFIEGFVRELEEGVKEVVWQERDYENKRCIFKFVKE